MPGGRLRSFRLGDRTELLAECVLNPSAFTSRTPRQEDVGHDFVCVLSELKEKFYWTGPSFTVQVKSSASDLVLEKEHEMDWLKGQENPFFIAVGDRSKMTLDIYATWNRLNGTLYKGADKIVLRLGPPPSGQAHVTTDDGGSEQLIHLDKPVISTTLQEVLELKGEERVRSLMRQWVEVDRRNIVNNAAGVNWVIGPASYETNEELDSSTQWAIWIYWNPKNLTTCRVNACRACAALLLAAKAAKLGAPPEAKRLSDLEALLKSHADFVNSTTKEALKNHAGLTI